MATARSDLPAAVAPTTETTRGRAGRDGAAVREVLTGPVSQNRRRAGVLPTEPVLLGDDMTDFGHFRN
ncbi:hypothetical protein GCM10010505_22530 [Kitasatospora aburaviensis]